MKPIMQFGTYCRIEADAGGITCTDREFIKAAHGRLSTSGKSRTERTWRHLWLRDGVAKLNSNRKLLDLMGLRT